MNTPGIKLGLLLRLHDLRKSVNDGAAYTDGMVLQQVRKYCEQTGDYPGDQVTLKYWRDTERQPLTYSRLGIV